MECTGNCVQIEEFNETTSEMAENAAGLRSALSEARAEITKLEWEIAIRKRMQPVDRDDHPITQAAANRMMAELDTRAEMIAAKDARIAELEAKVAKALALGWADSEWEPIKRVELAELEKDRERLDWLNTEPFPKSYKRALDLWWKLDEPNTFREVIDAALAAANGEGGR